MMRAKFLLMPLIAALEILVLLTASYGTTVVSASERAPLAGNETCIKCHEDLYFLHDTGKWYCLRESPMSCVDCHGGNPLATAQKQAHMDRSAHPVLNTEISKCQECHPQECMERLEKFERVAGIDAVLVAASYVPRVGSESTSITERQENHDAWLNIRDVFAVLFLIGMALVVYNIYKKHWTIRKPQ